MSYRDLKDNEKIKIDEGVIIGTPVLYKTFDEVKGCVLKGREGNKLILERDGVEKQLYIHGTIDVIYLSDHPADPNERMSIGEHDPFEFLIGKEITHVDKYGFRYYEGRNLPTQVFLGVDSDEIPFEVMLYHDDGYIMVYVNPSLRNMRRIASKIMSKDPEQWGEADVFKMAKMKGAWSTQTLGGINVFNPLSEEEFGEEYPQAYKRILEVQAREKEKSRKTQQTLEIEP